jgi:hypothetical protein
MSYNSVKLERLPEGIVYWLAHELQERIEPWAFGDYIEVYDGTDNMACSRSVPCIALYPCNNMTGSWAFLNLSMKQYIRSSQWQKMRTTEAIRP